MICSIVFIELDFSNCGPISGRDVDVHGPLGGRAQVEGPDAGDDALRHEHASFHLQVWLLFPPPSDVGFYLRFGH